MIHPHVVKGRNVLYEIPCQNESSFKEVTILDIGLNNSDNVSSSELFQIIVNGVSESEDEDAPSSVASVPYSSLFPLQRLAIEDITVGKELLLGIQRNRRNGIVQHLYYPYKINRIEYSNDPGGTISGTSALSKWSVLINCVRCMNDSNSPSSNHPPPSSTAVASSSSSTKLPQFCDVQLYDSGDGFVSVMNGLFSSGLVLQVPNPVCSLFRSDANGNINHPISFSKLKKSMCTVVDYFTNRLTTSQANVVHVNTTSSPTSVVSSITNHERKKVFNQLDSIFQQFLFVFHRYIEVLSIGSENNETESIKAEDQKSNKDLSREQLLLDIIETMNEFCRVIDSIPVLYSAFALSSVNNTSTGSGNDRFFTSEETIYLLANMWRIQYHLSQLLNLPTTTAMGINNQENGSEHGYVKTPVQSPSKNPKTPQIVSSPSVNSPLKLIQQHQQTIEKLAGDIIQKIDNYSVQSYESITSWMDILISSNVMKQDWTSTSPYLRNRKVTPCLLLISSLLQLLQSKFDHCCNFSGNGYNVQHQATDLLSSDIVQKGDISPMEQPVETTHPEVENEKGAVVNAHGKDVNHEDQVISLLPPEEETIVKSAIDTIDKQSNITEKTTTNNENKDKRRQSCSAFTAQTPTDLDKNVYCEIVSNKVKEFMANVIESVCRSIIQHYGLVSTELGDMLNSSLSRVRLLQWQVDMSFVWEELMKIVQKERQNSHSQPSSLKQKYFSIHSYLSIIEVALFISRGSTQDVISFIKQFIVPPNPSADSLSTGDRFEAQAGCESSSTGDLEGYCCGMNKTSCARLLKSILGESSTNSDDVLGSEEHKKCLMEELKGINEHFDKNLDLHTLLDVKLSSSTVDNSSIRSGWIFLALRNVHILNLFKASSFIQRTQDILLQDRANLAESVRRVHHQMEIVFKGENEHAQFIDWLKYILSKFRFELIEAAYPPLTDVQKEDLNHLKDLVQTF